MAKLYFPAKFSHTEAEASEPTPRWAMRRTRPYATSSVLKSQRGKTIGQYVRLIQFICACVAAYTDGHVVIDVTASRHPSPAPPIELYPDVQNVSCDGRRAANEPSKMSIVSMQRARTLALRRQEPKRRPVVSRYGYFDSDHHPGIQY